MSENSSLPSQTFASPSGENEDLTDDLDLGFDGAEDILRTWRRGIRPDPDLTVSEWADQHRWLSSRASAEPGRYLFNRPSHPKRASIATFSAWARSLAASTDVPVAQPDGRFHNVGH